MYLDTCSNESKEYTALVQEYSTPPKAPERTERAREIYGEASQTYQSISQPYEGTQADRK